MTINILMIGDVVGSAGCKALRQCLPRLKREYSADLVIVNGENSADGNGVLPSSAGHIFDSGADVITGGNHSFRRRECYELLDTAPFLLRPANYPDTAPGKGMCIVDRGSYKAAVISLSGVVYLEPLRCPFETADRLVDEAKQAGAHFIIVDFHAEATGEKKALGYYLDGRITALVGTHTHVPTADAQILPEGAGYLTDVGMAGPSQSVLGVKPESSIARLKGKIPLRFENAAGPCLVNGVLITADRDTGKALSIKTVVEYIQTA